MFGLNGMLFGSWITRIPEVKHRLFLSEAELGLALFGLPLGALLLMPLMGAFTARLGTGRATLLTACAVCVSIFLPALATSYGWLIVSLLVFGGLHGAMDIAMNATAATIEAQQQRSIMSSCHGFWSVGAMLGAATGSLAYGLGMPFTSQLLLLCGGLLGLCYVLRPVLAPIAYQRQDEPLFAWPRKNLWILALVGFCSMFGEGGIADWTGVYMQDGLMASPVLAGLAYTGFSLSMALGRFYGDALIERLGARRMVVWGTGLAALCILVVVLSAQPLVAITGLTLAGMGFAVIVPVVFGEAAKEPGMVPGASIASVASMGYVGLLAGPPLLGFVAQAWGLPLAIGLIGLLCALACGLMLLRG